LAIDVNDIRILLTEFAEHAGDLGVVVERLASSGDAARAIERFALELAVKQVIISTELQESAPYLIAALEAAGVDWHSPGGAVDTQHERFGLSYGHLAIAETGSILVAEETLADRAIGMLVAIQVIVCQTGSLVRSLDDAAPVLRGLAQRPGGAYTTLVTGPSRTADIERVLTVGVQGPARVIILLVDSLD
jgi:L-lactate dehydrogenase complex protein LldG